MWPTRSAADQLGRVLALGRVGFTNTQDTTGAATTLSASFELVANALQVSALQEVVVRFLNPESLASGFDELHFRAELRDQIVVDETFDELVQAIAYFDDRVLELGTFGIDTGDTFHPTAPLRLSFDLTTSEQGAGFGLDLLVGLTAIPEPSTALLLVLGLFVLGARRRDMMRR